MVMAWPLEVCLQTLWTSLTQRILKDKLVWAVIHRSDRSLIFFKNRLGQASILRQKLSLCLRSFSFTVDFYWQYFESVTIHFQNIAPSLGFNCGVNLRKDDILPCGTYWKEVPLLWTLGDLCLSPQWPWDTCWLPWSSLSVYSPPTRWR